MREVIDSVEQELPQGYESGLGMDGGATPRLGRHEPQDARHLAARDLHQIELLVEVALVVLNRLGVAEAVRPDQKRTIHCQRPLHPVGEELLAVRDVADEFERAPLSLYRAATKFVLGHARNGGSKVGSPALVRCDQVGSALRFVVSLGISNHVGSGHALPKDNHFIRRIPEQPGFAFVPR